MITLTRCSSTPSAEIFRKTAGLHALDAAGERPLPAPPLDLDRHPGLHPDGVGREVVGDDFQIRGVSHLHERLAGRHDGFALAQPPQHDAVDRRAQRQVLSWGALLRRLDFQSARLRGAQLLHRSGRGALGGGKRALCALQVLLRPVEILLRRNPARRQAPDPGVLRPRELELRARAIAFGPGALYGRPRRADTGFDLAARAQVEERRVARNKGRQNRCPGLHRVPGLELDAPEPAGDRRGDDVALADPCLALLVEGHREPAAGHGSHVHLHGRRSQCERQRDQSDGRDSAPQRPAANGDRLQRPTPSS
jgi:hypothetical protein